MPTNPIPEDVMNVSINFPRAERSILGRLALENDLSLGSFVRRALLDWMKVHHPEHAEEIARIRTERKVARLAKARPVYAAAMLFLTLATIAQSLFSPDASIARQMRSRNRGGRKRDELFADVDEFDPELPKVRVAYLGYQEGFGDIPGVHLYNVIETVCDTLQEGMTVGPKTIAAAGFEAEMEETA